MTVMGIADIDFGVIDSPLDDNPNAGGGLDLPGQESPQDPVNRRTVRVEAITVPHAPGLPVTSGPLTSTTPSPTTGPWIPTGLKETTTGGSHPCPAA